LVVKVTCQAREPAELVVDPDKQYTTPVVEAVYAIMYTKLSWVTTGLLVCTYPVLYFHLTDPVEETSP
jgi:hypothetical protein